MRSSSSPFLPKPNGDEDWTFPVILRLVWAHKKQVKTGIIILALL
jgi:hypothetical protein